MAEVDFGGIRKDVCLRTSPTSGSATTCWSTWASPSSGSTRRPAHETLERFASLGIPRGARRAGGAVVRYLEEFADPDLARRLLDRIHASVTRPWA